jgi:hypothetical protein
MRDRKLEIAPMTDRSRSSHECDWSPFTKNAARSSVLSAIGQALNGRFEVPQDLPREMIVLLMRLNEVCKE